MGRQGQPSNMGAAAERPVPEQWPVGGAAAALTLTANAGVLLCWHSHKLLVDGLHSGGGGQFSAVPPWMQRDIVAGCPPFDGIGWLLFTHLHADHFSEDLILRFLSRHPQAHLLMPEQDEGQSVFCRKLEEQGNIPQLLATRRSGPVLLRLAPGLEVTAFYVEHDGAQYRDMEHNCLLVSLDGRNVLFLGDAAQDMERLGEVLQGTRVDTVITNPLFLNRPAGRETLIRAIQPAKIVVNHIPFAWEDPHRFREMVARTVSRWRSVLPPVAVLWNPLDNITI